MRFRAAVWALSLLSLAASAQASQVAAQVQSMALMYRFPGSESMVEYYPGWSDYSETDSLANSLDFEIADLDNRGRARAYGRVAAHFKHLGVVTRLDLDHDYPAQGAQVRSAGYIEDRITILPPAGRADLMGTAGSFTFPFCAEMQVNYLLSGIVSNSLAYQVSGSVGDELFDTGLRNLSFAPGGASLDIPLDPGLSQVDFIWGRPLPISLSASLFLYGEKRDPEDQETEGEFHVEASFGGSSHWLGLQNVRDSAGNPVTGFAASSESGTDYLSMAPTPEPSTIAMIAVVPAALLRRRRHFDALWERLQSRSGSAGHS